MPAFCGDVEWPVLEWEMLFDQHGVALPGEAQEESWFHTPKNRAGEIGANRCQRVFLEVCYKFDETSRIRGRSTTRIRR